MFQSFDALLVITIVALQGMIDAILKGFGISIAVVFSTVLYYSYEIYVLDMTRHLIKIQICRIELCDELKCFTV